MVEAIFNLILLGVGIAAAIVWIINLVKYNTELTCDPDECENCPFPCERQEGDNDEWTK